MEFSEACCEVDYILDNLNPDDKKKIPEKVIDFFKKNKSSIYNVNLTTEKPLAQQTLKDETKAFLQILNYKYFANEKQKEEFKKIFKDENVNELLFENTKLNLKIETIEIDEDLSTELTIYKENKLISFFKRILKFLKN